MRRTLIIVVLILIVAAVLGWRAFNPGPMAFAPGRR